MIAETLSVGTELLLGQIVDTNAAHIARTLSSIGVSLYYRATVGDNSDRMREAMRQALSRADLVITIGGLGPTMDDLTKEIVCEVMDAPMGVDPEQDARLHEIIAHRNFRVPEAFFKQAVLPLPPRGRAVPNPVGTAPGVWVEKDGKIAVCLPGPPFELIPMLEQSVVPWLTERLGGERTVIRSRVLRIIGIGESMAEEAVKDLMAGTNPTIAPYAKLGECQLRVTALARTDEEADALIAPVETEVRCRLGTAVYGIDDQTIEYATVQLLRERQLTVATAESCTGGLISARITSVAGSSDVFGTGIVSYSNETKTRLLSVPSETIQVYGAVSEETAEAMATGVRKLAGSDYGVSVTGIAGPGGGTEDKPVGLVYIGLAGGSGVEVSRHQFSGSRDTVRQRAANAAIAILRDAVLSR